MKFAAVLVLMTGFTFGCQSAGDPTLAVFGPPQTALLVGQFRAISFGDHAILYASGFNPSTGWRPRLGSTREEPGVFQLRSEVPQDAIGAAMAPFVVSIVLPPAASTNLRVRDALGVREIAIERAETISFSDWERLAYSPSKSASH